MVCSVATSNRAKFYPMVKSDISSRIRQAIKKTGKTQMEIAELVGVSNAAVTKWLKSGSIAIDTLTRLAKVTDNSFEWLATGSEGLNNIEPVPTKSNMSMVPLVSWVQAGSFCDAPDNIAQHQAEEYLPCPAAIGPRGYALTVKGDSMTSPHSGDKSYPDGCVIYIDPDKEVTNGCRVVAHIEGTDQVTFKTYVEDAGRRYLKPINPQYPMIDITEHTRICGVVVCKVDFE